MSLSASFERRASFESRHQDAVRALREHPDVAEWSLLLEERTSLSVGAKDNQVGGVYAPPKVTRELSGSLYVLWKERISGDAAVSRTRVDALWLRDPKASLRALRARAYPEKFVIDLPEDRPIPEVSVYDRKVDDLVRKDPGFAFDALAELAPRLTKKKSAFAGEFGATVGRYRITNSRGLDREAQTTLSSFSAEADSLFGVSAARRDLLDRATVTTGLDRLNEWLPYFDPRETARETATLPVVLLPDAAASFLSHFVLGNLDGESVANAQSAWRANDFTDRKQVFSEKLSLAFDPLEDWRSWSYRIDRRGLPAARTSYVERGRLVSPVVSLKAAKQLSCAPSPIPSSSGLTIRAAADAELDRYVADLERAVIVPSVLGMHTQDAARGNYSLSVPRALLVEKGKITGAAKAVLSGNFFDELSGDVVALSTPVDENRGLAWTGKVQVT